MAAPDKSGLILRSLGVVLRNKEEKSDMIVASPTEVFPSNNGPIQPYGNKITATYADKDGVKKTSTSESGQVWEAKWIPYGDSNRDSAPDVCAGESVLLYQYANSPEYYWTTFMREPYLRGKECVRYVFSNTDSGVAVTDDTSYFMEYNTRLKRIWLHTSDNDGEAAKFDILIDCKTGMLTIVDGTDQGLSFDSPGGRLLGKFDELIDLTAKVINLNATDAINAKATTVTADGELVATKGIDMQGGEGGTMKIKGNMEQQGTFSNSGGFQTDGDVRATGEVHGSNI